MYIIQNKPTYPKATHITSKLNPIETSISCSDLYKVAILYVSHK